jgi:hypothetical protein
MQTLASTWGAGLRDGTVWVWAALVGVSGCFVSDEELSAAYDRDGDGYQPAINGGPDCDNDDANIHPDAPEVCGDGVDNNCDGVIDDDGEGSIVWHRDDDGDGFGVADDTVWACQKPSGYADADTDCDDTDALVNPTVTDVCDDTDNDCDGDIDEDRPPTPWYSDGDDDGFGAGNPFLACEAPAGTVVEDGDCDDGDASVRPGQTEVVADGVDQDCDGVDDCYGDGDGDGFGGLAAVVGADLSCENAGESRVSTDCDDSAGTVFPGAAEGVADGVDQDCDGSDTCWADGDGDGHGTPLLEVVGGRSELHRAGRGDQCRRLQ